MLLVEEKEIARNYYEKYTDEFGRFSLYPRSKNKRRDYDNENTTIFSSYIVFHTFFHSVQDSDYTARLERVIEDSFIVKGLLMREPKKEWNYYPKDHPRESGYNYNSHDNYIGMAIISVFLDREWAGDTLDYMKSNFFSLNDEKPYEFTFRQVSKPYVYSYLKCVENEAHIGHQLILLFSFISTGLNKSADLSGELIKFYMYQTLVYKRSAGFLVMLGYKIYRRQLIRRFGSEWIVRIHGDYFKNERHPIHDFARIYQLRGMERV